MRWSVALLTLAIVGFGIGIGWWIHPGAGIAAASVALAVLALLIDVPEKGRP